MKNTSNTKPFPKLGFLKESEKQTIIDFLSQGKGITEAMLFIGRNFCPLANSKWNDPEFAATIKELINGQVEQALLDLSKGKPAKVVLETRCQKRGPDGQIVRDADGNPILELNSTKEMAIRQDQQAIQLWLQTHKSDVYGQTGQTQQNLPEEDPDQLRAKMLKEALDSLPNEQ